MKSNGEEAEMRQEKKTEWGTLLMLKLIGSRRHYLMVAQLWCLSITRSHLKNHTSRHNDLIINGMLKVSKNFCQKLEFNGKRRVCVMESIFFSLQVLWLFLLHKHSLWPLHLCSLQKNNTHISIVTVEVESSVSLAKQGPYIKQRRAWLQGY